MAIGLIIWMRTLGGGAGLFGVSGPWYFVAGFIGCSSATPEGPYLATGIKIGVELNKLDAIEALQDMAGWLKTHGFRGFVGEFGVLLGSYLTLPVLAIIAGFGVILAAVYMLWAYERVFTGPVTNPKKAANALR